MINKGQHTRGFKSLLLRVNYLFSSKTNLVAGVQVWSLGPKHDFKLKGQILRTRPGPQIVPVLSCVLVKFLVPDHQNCKKVPDLQEVPSCGRTRDLSQLHNLIKRHCITSLSRITATEICPLVCVDPKG